MAVDSVGLLHMKQFIKARAGLIVIIAILLICAILILSRIPPFGFKQGINDGYVVEVVNGIRIEQSFIAHYPGLTQISVALAKPIMTLDQDIIFVLKKDQPNADNLLTLRRKIEEVREGDWLTFTFDPLDEKPPQIYSFSLKSESSSPVRLKAHHLDMYPEGELNGGGDLVFRVIYKGAPIPTLRALLTRVTDNKPGLFGRAWFYLALLSALIVTYIGAGYALARSITNRSSIKQLVDENRSTRNLTGTNK
jgi:hypothetical protein